MKFGFDFEESEITTSNDQFYAGGNGFFRSINNALKHFDKLSDNFVRQDNVDDLCPSGSMRLSQKLKSITREGCKGFAIYIMLSYQPCVVNRNGYCKNSLHPI